MDLHPIDGGPAATPKRPPYPAAVAESLSYLANLIDESIRVRGTGISVRDWAANFLGLAPTEVAVTTSTPDLLTGQLMAIALAEDLEAHAPLDMIGADQEEAPDWVKLELGDVTTRVPAELAATFGAGHLILPPVVVQVTRPWNESLQIRVYSRGEHMAAAEAYLESLSERGRTRANPFRNRTLETVTTMIGLTFRVLSGTPPTTRADVVLPERVWDEVDRNVHGLYRSLERLTAAGLACNRGILLAGPPGTGKTALCRALAHELDGSVTVIFCDAATVSANVRDLYKQLQYLAPALVVMEDVDLVVGDRNRGASGALLDFLVALDGAMSDHRGVVTIATTNDPASIDPAAKRSARFDVLIEVPAPDTDGRAAILGRYLRDLPSDPEVRVDISRVAAATAGFSGADLRELVSDAVLHTAAGTDADVAAALTTTLLVRLATARRSTERIGLYL